jgi:hypothetical protein
MWIKLLRPYAVFYPPRVESAGSIHSIGTPRGASMVAAGIAEETAKPPERDGHPLANMDPIHTCEPPQHSQLADCGEMSAEASALVAALGRRRRKNT